jgi:hypothetical protein
MKNEVWHSVVKHIEKIESFTIMKNMMMHIMVKVKSVKSVDESIMVITQTNGMMMIVLFVCIAEKI